jgi:superfamily II DNA or RNA helicase
MERLKSADLTVVAGAAEPEIGSLVEVRGHRWVVGTVDRAASTLLELQSVEDGRYGETLTVVWQVEPGARVLPAGSLPDIDGGFDPPEHLAAFLDAVRWGAVTSADVSMLQAPFRSGVAVEDYQLEPVARALTAPRVNLLLADDVGLGKTIEAGLVVQELLLRQRARRAMVVCPAGLTAKWQQEMADRFGLDFTIVNSEQCKMLRLTHGSAANPFEVYPFVIVSLPWLRGPRAQRLLDEVLPTGGPSEQRRFDLLILDEAHHVAPAAPRQRYAVDSQQTKLLRRLVPHFEHRLFLSATPHNGYLESFTALLELIDNQRFARGVAPDEVARREVMVRRLKTDVVDEHGNRKFAPRADVPPLVVEYPPAEREVHALLTRFAQIRRHRTKAGRRRATDLVTLLLKKRLFSSPDAFGKTVAVLRETYNLATRNAADADESWVDAYLGDLEDADDEEVTEREEIGLRRAGRGLGNPTAEELELLAAMETWARQHTANPDAKAAKLTEYLRAVCIPDGRHWLSERVVVFTEYRDTLTWLRRLLTQDGLGERIEVFHGGLTVAEKEAVRQAFQADPADPDAKVRILLATDAAGEGIDLHWHCHRLVNYDIPFNPNKLEQRIGRIDRYGQQFEPEIRHFVGAGWENTADTFAADLEFLSRVARKVAQIEYDLGAVNAVLADTVQRRMLGERVDVDAALQAKTSQRRRGRLASDADVSGQVRRLREQVDQTVMALNLTPATVERVVRTSLRLARQDTLKPAYDPDQGIFEVPPLTGPWARAAERLPHPLRPEELRPVTFDPEIARRRREDVVYAHLGHPLVAMSTRLLRAAVTGVDGVLHRVTAVLSDTPGMDATLVGAYARFIIVGGDGVRLHEEVLHAGGWLREAGRGFARIDGVGEVDRLLGGALASGIPAPGHLRDRLVRAWPRTRDGLVAALNARARNRQQSLTAVLEKRRADEERRISDNLDRFGMSLREALGETGTAEHEQLMLDLRDPAEIRQADADRRSWRERLDNLVTEKATELVRIRQRYADPKVHLFPVAVVVVVPRREAMR